MNEDIFVNILSDSIVTSFTEKSDSFSFRWYNRLKRQYEVCTTYPSNKSYESIKRIVKQRCQRYENCKQYVFEQLGVACRIEPYESRETENWVSTLMLNNRW